MPAGEQTAAATFAPLGALEALRLLRSAGGALTDQATLHGALLRLEWAQEKVRLLKMIVLILLGLAFVVGVLLAAGALMLALAWDTGWRVHAAAALLVAYALGAALAWRGFSALAARGEQSFAASRAELGADVALLRERF